ncbi:MAG TPA: DUF4398 domain-containing protein [Vicinamibacterales bacterium]|nr:DUF4398 domain-containing protein [Vicinamibacterales bacterium]
MPRRPSAFLVLPFILILAACAVPPSKEMDRAQGAIESARAAGADQYATTEFTAATDALRKSEEAAAQRDFRLALSLAIDSFSQAQTAAKAAVEARAKSRGDAERAASQVNTLLVQANSHLADPAIAKLPRRTVEEVRGVIDAAQKVMQEARAAIEAHDYARALSLTDGVAARIQAAIAALDAPPPTAPARRRR